MKHYTQRNTNKFIKMAFDDAWISLNVNKTGFLLLHLEKRILHVKTRTTSYFALWIYWEKIAHGHQWQVKKSVIAFHEFSCVLERLIHFFSELPSSFNSS